MTSTSTSTAPAASCRGATRSLPPALPASVPTPRPTVAAPVPPLRRPSTLTATLSPLQALTRVPGASSRLPPRNGSPSWPRRSLARTLSLSVATFARSRTTLRPFALPRLPRARASPPPRRLPSSLPASRPSSLLSTPTTFRRPSSTTSSPRLLRLSPLPRFSRVPPSRPPMSFPTFPSAS